MRPDQEEENPGWRSPGRQDAKTVRNRWLIGGTAVGAIILIWILTSRPSDETIPAGGFNVGAAGSTGVMAPTFKERRADTGLAMVRRAFNAPTQSAQPEGGPAATPSGGAPSAPPAPAGETGSLADIGAPTDKDGLARLGSEKGLMSALMGKALEHPTILKMLLNNKILVDAYFSRDLVKKNCGSGLALKNYLSNGADPQGVSEEISMAKTFLAHPDAATASLDTEFAHRMMDCPSVKAMEKDPGSAMAVLSSNPAAMGIFGDPSVGKVLSSNQQASTLFSEAQSAAGGALGAAFGSGSK